MTTTATFVALVFLLLAIARVHGTTVKLAVVWANSPPSITAGWAEINCSTAAIPASASFDIGAPVIVYNGEPCPPSGCLPVMHGAKAYCYKSQQLRQCSADYQYNGPAGSNNEPAEPLSAGQSLAPGCGIRDNGCRYRGGIQTQVQYRGWAANMGDGIWRTTSNASVHCSDVLDSLQWPQGALRSSLEALAAGSTWVVTRQDPQLELTTTDWDSMNRMGLYNMFALMSWPEMDQYGCSQFNGGHPDGASNICYQNLHAGAGVNTGQPHAGWSIEITGPCTVKWDPDRWTRFLLDNAVAVSGTLENNNWPCYSNPCPSNNNLNIPMPTGYVRAACISQFANAVTDSPLEGLNVAQQWVQCQQAYPNGMRGACAATVAPVGIQIPCTPSKTACRGGQTFGLYMTEWEGVPPVLNATPPTPQATTTGAPVPATTATTTASPATTSGAPSSTTSATSTAATTSGTTATSAAPTTGAASTGVNTTSAASTTATSLLATSTTASTATAAPVTNASTTGTALSTTAAADTTAAATTTVPTSTTAAVPAPTTTTTAANNCTLSVTCSDCFASSGGICHWGNNGTGPNECSGPENPPPFVVGCGSGSGSGPAPPPTTTTTPNPGPPPATTATPDPCLLHQNCSTCLGAGCLWGYNNTGFISCSSTAQAGQIASCNNPVCNSGSFTNCNTCNAGNCGWCNSTMSCQDSQFQCTGGWLPFPNQC